MLKPMQAAEAAADAAEDAAAALMSCIILRRLLLHVPKASTMLNEETGMCDGHS